MTVGDNDFRQETEERVGESQPDNGGDPHLSPVAGLGWTDNCKQHERSEIFVQVGQFSVFRLNWFPFTAQYLTEMEIVIRQINITQASSEVSCSCNASY